MTDKASNIHTASKIPKASKNDSHEANILCSHYYFVLLLNIINLCIQCMNIGKSVIKSSISEYAFAFQQTN